MKPSTIEGTESRAERSRREQAGPRARHEANIPDLLIVAVLIAFVVGLNVEMSGLIPTGADPGNWLAIARDSVGMDAMSADVSYPPLLPFLLAGLLLLAGPITAIVTVAVLAKAAMIIAFYVCVRPVGRAFAAVGALLISVAGAQLEAHLWGAYPQMIATSFALLAVYFVNRYVGTGERIHFLIGLGLVALTTATHLLLAGLLVLALPISLAHRFWMSRVHYRAWMQKWWVLALLMTPGVLYVGSQLLNTQLEPTLNPLEAGRADSLVETFRDALPLWGIVGVAGLGTLLWRTWPERHVPTVSVGSSWTVVGALFFVFTAERRALLLIQVGLLILAIVGFQRLDRASLRKAAVEHARPALGRLQSKLLVTIGIGISVGIVAGGIAGYSATSEWYRVVDTQELRGLDALEEAQQGDLVIAARGNSGIQVGWWVEGYIGLPTYSGVDPRLAAFPDEREQAEIANEIFSGELSDLETRSRLQAVGADYLVLDRRGPDAPWLETSLPRSLPVLYDSPTLVILRFPG